ncbi:hypothetical protein AX774_g6221 [Zancudomyces culisetae]|uniref:Uncharacterized protein n=1 Tax=Zancudomyces culisetae TaxID=1213189 RepID=A0A1R1PH98_ZANCU|nr:hypothetical protein AX774_g6221 [Zancudomyces culisetae]|eukprot:OMH80350.1 hypothetical protein AX774_g6221 [Zancudomyces culisetae]
MLTGKQIPSHISSLPSDFLSTELGQTLSPLVETFFGRTARSLPMQNNNLTSSGGVGLYSTQVANNTSDQKDMRIVEQIQKDIKNKNDFIILPCGKNGSNTDEVKRIKESVDLLKRHKINVYEIDSRNERISELVGIDDSVKDTAAFFLGGVNYSTSEDTASSMLNSYLYSIISRETKPEVQILLVGGKREYLSICDRLLSNKSDAMYQEYFKESSSLINNGVDSLIGEIKDSLQLDLLNNAQLSNNSSMDFSALDEKSVEKLCTFLQSKASASDEITVISTVKLLGDVLENALKMENDSNHNTSNDFLNVLSTHNGNKKPLVLVETLEKIFLEKPIRLQVGHQDNVKYLYYGCIYGKVLCNMAKYLVTKSVLSQHSTQNGPEFEDKLEIVCDITDVILNTDFEKSTQLLCTISFGIMADCLVALFGYLQVSESDVVSVVGEMDVFNYFSQNYLSITKNELFTNSSGYNDAASMLTEIIDAYKA